MATAVPSLSDLRYAYYGGGSAAEYAFLKAAQTAGMTASKMLTQQLAQFNVQTYGAVADGVTDNLAAFNAAKAAAVAAGGGVITIGPGTYILSDEFRLDASNVWMVGAGMGITLLKNTAGLTKSVVVLGLTGAVTNVALKNLSVTKTINNIRAANNGYGVMLARVTQGMVQGVESYNIAGVGIGCLGNAQASGNVDCLITENYVHDTYADGIGIFSFGTRVKIFNNRVYNTGDDSISCNSYNGETGNVDCVIAYNDIRAAGGAGIAVRGSQKTRVEFNQVITSFLAGILAEATAAYQSIDTLSIRGNHLELCSSLATSGPNSGGALAPAGVGGSIVLNNNNAGRFTQLVTIEDNFIQNSAFNFICCYGTVMTYKSLIRIQRNLMLGAITGGAVANRAAPTVSLAGCFIEGWIGPIFANNYMYAPLDQALEVATNNSGSVRCADNSVDTVNQNGGGAVAGAFTFASGAVTVINNTTTSTGAAASAAVSITGTATTVFNTQNSLS